jgi:hypothetical protein
VFKIISIGGFIDQSQSYNNLEKIELQALYSYTKLWFLISGHLRVPYNSFCILVRHNFLLPLLLVTSHTLLFVPLLPCKHISRPVKINAQHCVMLTKRYLSAIYCKFVHLLRSLSYGKSTAYSTLKLHWVPSNASFFNFHYPHFSLNSFSSCLHLLSRLPFTSIFPLTTCFRRQFLRNVWPIQLAFLLFILHRLFLSSLTLSNTSSFLTRSVQLIFSVLLQHHIS